MSKKIFIPDRGDIVWLNFTPQAGHEQAGVRPALVISPKGYNEKTSLALCCPITSQTKGYPFEVPIPKGLKISGVILADHIKNLDWRARKAKFNSKVPAQTLEDTITKLALLIR